MKSCIVFSDGTWFMISVAYITPPPMHITPPGYERNDGVCTPCSPGFYSTLLSDCMVCGGLILKNRIKRRSRPILFVLLFSWQFFFVHGDNSDQCGVVDIYPV